MSGKYGSPGAVDTGARTMFSAIPFANVTDAPVTQSPAFIKPPSATNPVPPPTLADGTYELLYSSGKVAAEAALNSVRNFWSLLAGPTMDPLTKPAGTGDMVRAGAGGGDVIANWSGVLADDAKIAGQKIKSGATSLLDTAGTGVKKTLNWAGSAVGSTIGGIFSGLGFAGSSVIILIVAGVAIFFLGPYISPIIAARVKK